MKVDLRMNGVNTRYLFLAVLGGIISLVGYLFYALNPLLSIVDKLATLEPGSLLFKLWTEPPYEILAKIYIFNVTNREAFLAGKEKLKFNETGPYVYQEILRNAEGHFNENGTLTFKPRRELILRKDYSASDPDLDTIISPNIPLLGISSFVYERQGRALYQLFSFLAPTSPSMTNLTASEYLFGYEDPIVTMAHSFIPSWIDFSKFGIIDRLMALDNGDNTVTIHLENSVGITDDKDSPKMYSIHRFNGSPGLKQWGYEDVEQNQTSPKNTRCNTLEGAFDAGLFPKNLKENTTLGLYRRAFCRSVQMKYEGTNFTSSGVKYYDYRIDQNFLETLENNEDNRCYCRHLDTCMPKGFGSISPCYYGIPITMSQPHYLNVDPAVMAQVEGMQPDREKHDTVMKINPDFGIPIAATLRIQVNLKVTDADYFHPNVAPFKGMMIPLFWVELGLAGTPSEVNFYLHLAKAVPVIEIVCAWVFGLLGISLIATALLIVFYFPPEHRLEDPFGSRVGYSPILVIPMQHIKSDIGRIS